MEATRPIRAAKPERTPIAISEIALNMLGGISVVVVLTVNQYSKCLLFYSNCKIFKILTVLLE